MPVPSLYQVNQLPQNYFRFTAGIALPGQLVSKRCKLYWIHVFPTAPQVNAAYLKLFDSANAGAAIIGSTPISFTLLIPALAVGLPGIVQFPDGLGFDTGLGAYASGAALDNDATAVAGDFIVQGFFK